MSSPSGWEAAAVQPCVGVYLQHSLSLCVRQVRHGSLLLLLLHKHVILLLSSLLFLVSLEKVFRDFPIILQRDKGNFPDLLDSMRGSESLMAVSYLFPDVLGNQSWIFQQLLVSLSGVHTCRLRLGWSCCCHRPNKVSLGLNAHGWDFCPGRHRWLLGCARAANFFCNLRFWWKMIRSEPTSQTNAEAPRFTEKLTFLQFGFCWMLFKVLVRHRHVYLRWSHRPPRILFLLFLKDNIGSKLGYIPSDTERVDPGFRIVEYMNLGI